MIIKGWPERRDECPQNLRNFWNYRDELSILDGLVLKGIRIVIPEQCKTEVLEKLHEGHFGIEHTKLRARDSVYWLQINKDVETLIKTCEKCQEHSRRNNKDVILPREIPLVPWTLLEMDIFTCEDQSFLLTVDVTSRFPVVRILANETTRSVLNAIKGIYCDFGLPKRVLLDNGPCFKSREFKEFHAKLNISVENTSAYNHRSVGSAEHMVQTIKQIMMKNGSNAWLAMLIYRATDIPGINKSPSEFLNGCKFRTNLPMVDLHKKDSETEIEKLYEKHENMPQYGKELPSIPVGSRVLYEKNPDSMKIKCPEWVKGTVSDKLNKRKYRILSDNDRVITRSRCHIKGYQTWSGRISKAPAQYCEI